MVADLNSNPEILLKKRKNADRKRIEKQEAARQRQEEARRKRNQKKERFVRAETLVSNHRTAEIEKLRIQHLVKNEKITKQISAAKEIEGDFPAKLLFIIRVPPHKKGIKIPSKSQKVLSLLRLTKANTGVFIKLTPTVLPLLKLIHPYVVCGKPSLASVRQLFQKRASINVRDEETQAVKVTKLNNNAVVEEELGELGFICIEDLIHEVIAMGDNFKQVTFWLNPFKLNYPISGYGPLAKLQKLEYASENERKISIAGNTPLTEINIDKFIEGQN
ncbi:hypothetical protein BABINDRAFT_162426 [Babjeviella inositovora NRRL Y-12698]|uniref:Ribosome biogenesis protein RLP7 n=1 Tax=Babjeviella inositovora NRRL Y-12698 TaxID=984486 RepID=A0A1E3QMP2_9ASCO|nr:uncharacterized protein BABINDRAFT_162426 [Babjeviella inositovora NRRL Y-12698]ODQ78734.1 hypothetical protein BABINDRAFT_162426 [Babjeviella inositovora NRRL Y-12698]